MDIAPRGEVHLAGENWTALSDSGAISEGEHLTVRETEGVILKVFKTLQPDLLDENDGPAEEPT